MLFRDRNFLSLVSDRTFLSDSCVHRLLTNVVSNVVVDLLEKTTSLAPSLEEKCEVENLRWQRQVLIDVKAAP